MNLEDSVKTNVMLLALMLALAGCSGGDNNENNSASNTANNENNSADMGNSNIDVDNSGVEYASQYEVVFDSLAFSTQPANQLNMLLNANLDRNLDFPILVLMRIMDIDASAGTLTLEGGSGLKTAEVDVFEFDPESEPLGSAGTLDPASGVFSADIEEFGFVATFVFEGMENKTVLRIRELTIGGTMQLSEDGATTNVVNGTLSGYMTKEDGDMTEINLAPGSDPVTITEVFKEASLNYNSTTGEMTENGADDADAWFLEGSYTAEPTDIAD